MRLFEIAPQRTQGPEPALVAVLSFLKGKGDQRAAGVRVPVSSVLALMQNAGQPISYADIENYKETNQTIGNLIKGMDDQEIVLHTHNSDETENPEYQPGDEQDVAMMAKRAATRRD